MSAHSFHWAEEKDAKQVPKKLLLAQIEPLEIRGEKPPDVFSP